ncbi:hypothetical protein B0H12DRAFT_1151242 [Mycena haematopus]|nr:hypothetical protein B0H12DRAFT_1151242 [Mycena haematopus]
MATQAQVSAKPQALAHFTWDTLYEAARVSLWPVNATGPMAGEPARGEPPALLDCIESLTPDDGWLIPDGEKIESNVMDVDGSDNEDEGEGPKDGEDMDEGPPEIRYISLKTHPALAIHKLAKEVDWRGDEATLVIRHEYGLFMEHAMSRLSNPPDDSYRARFFVTGQPGIGKWSAFSLLLGFVLMLCVGQARVSGVTISFFVCSLWAGRYSSSTPPPLRTTSPATASNTPT